MRFADNRSSHSTLIWSFAVKFVHSTTPYNAVGITIDWTMDAIRVGLISPRFSSMFVIENSEEQAFRILQSIVSEHVSLLLSNILACVVDSTELITELPNFTEVSLKCELLKTTNLHFR